VNRELVFDNLTLALRLAAVHVADAPACEGFLLRRYRDAITTVADETPR